MYKPVTLRYDLIRFSVSNTKSKGLHFGFSEYQNLLSFRFT